jgi:hypothetical protein
VNPERICSLRFQKVGYLLQAAGDFDVLHNLNMGAGQRRQSSRDGD